MDEREFWIKVWKVIGAVFILTLLIANGSCQMTKQRVADMVANGADPIDAACAVSEYDRVICATRE